MTIDLIIKNANVLTLDENDTIARSVLVADGKIIKVCKESEPDTSGFNVGPNTREIDLNGATLLPGFIDTHSHLLMYGEMLDFIDCRSPENESITDIVQKVKAKAQHTPPGKWIMGWGYDDTLLAEKRHPMRDDLDQAAPDHPVFLRHISGHFAAVNSKALEIASITEQTPDPEGGFFGRYEDGRLDGVVHEIPALQLVAPALPKPTVEDLVEAIANGAKEYLAQGITTCTDAGVGLDKGAIELDAHLAAAQSGKNPLNMRLMILNHLFREDGVLAGYTAEQTDEELQQKSNGRVRLDSAKHFQDGSIQGYTAALREPYYSKPDQISELLNEQQAFNEEIADLHNRGFRIAIHGNGDRAIGSNIEALSQAVQKYPRDDHRHRIEHVQTASTADLRTMKQHGIAASFFINHVYYWGDRHRDIFLGPDRAERMNPLREAVDLDLLFTLHSDCPITPISPLFSVWAAVNRLTRNGHVLGESQKIDVVTALKSMTIYGAELNFEENEKGTIEEGKQADFAILAQDPLTCPPEEIKDIKVLATLINGETVWGDVPASTAVK
ncbi:amidohydrolase [Bacillus thermotolerans]|uniref:amidohydrolase n=1 Tax=Bacillus thermotolerans TaxID=1221996 RepID=UPI000589697E|nr:amidohydrolase [Bacillus thermotolerans]KKB44093.1 Exoenzymes regulatory protein AepA in lipid-linked oligosaccharide synthesis cluster [Bacillus thermotolerans]